LRDDPKFRDVYHDDHYFATYVRLLMIAEDAWPASAHLPYGVHRRALQKLADVGLIETSTGGLYRICGLDAERARRARESRNGGTVRAESAVRDGSGRFLPAGSPAVEPELDASAGTSGGSQRVQPAKPSQDEYETSQAEQGARAPDPADVYWTLTGRYPTDKVIAWVDDLSASYGTDSVIRALASTHQQDRNPSTLMGRTMDNLRAQARALSLKEQAAVRARLKERRAEPRVEVDQAAIQAEIRRLMEPGAAA
jgi:hypothetical protein